MWRLSQADHPIVTISRQHKGDMFTAEGMMNLFANILTIILAQTTFVGFQVLTAVVTKSSIF
jgi:hypothetical protein